MEYSASDPQQSRLTNDPMAILRTLLAAAGLGTDVAFGFDVLNGTFIVGQLSDHLGTRAIGGPMSLATYNDLKISQFILESDVLSRPGYRWFTLTERGRKSAELESI